MSSSVVALFIRRLLYEFLICGGTGFPKDLKNDTRAIARCGVSPGVVWVVWHGVVSSCVSCVMVSFHTVCHCLSVLFFFVSLLWFFLLLLFFPTATILQHLSCLLSTIQRRKCHGPRSMVPSLFLTAWSPRTNEPTSNTHNIQRISNEPSSSGSRCRTSQRHETQY